MTVEQLEKILFSKEGERLEFKEAKNQYKFKKLATYCAALANEGVFMWDVLTLCRTIRDNLS